MVFEYSILGRLYLLAKPYNLIGTAYQQLHIYIGNNVDIYFCETLVLKTQNKISGTRGARGASERPHVEDHGGPYGCPAATVSSLRGSGRGLQ